MTDNSKSLRLRELTNLMSSGIEKLQSGNLSRAELEKLTDQSRELHERLVVLRYLAYNAEIKGENTEDLQELDKTEHEPLPVINFKIEEPKVEIPVQVSLIDAIEEVTKAETQTIDETPSAADEAIPVSAPVVMEETSTKQASSLSDYIHANASKESLHERLSKEIKQPESLASKLEHHPIPDLKRAISLNQRFQFSKELFKGNNQDYEVAIDKLNSSSRDEAMKHLESLRNKYAWNSESAVAHDFVDLVERRHL